EPDIPPLQDRRGAQQHAGTDEQKNTNRDLAHHQAVAKACWMEIAAEVSSHGVHQSRTCGLYSGDQAKKQRGKPGGEKDEYKNPKIQLKGNYAQKFRIIRR